MIRLSDFRDLLDAALDILGTGAGRVEIVGASHGRRAPRRVRVGRLMGVEGVQTLPGEPPAAPVSIQRAAGVEGVMVRSPAVGVVSFEDNRTGRPLVEIGQQISGGQTLAFISALEITTKVVAPRSGIVEEVYVEDGDGVEYNAPLLKILPTQ